MISHQERLARQYHTAVAMTPAESTASWLKSLLGLLAVLVVGDVLAPGRAVAVVVHLEHREVGHEAVGRGAVPVLLAGLEEDAVAGTDDLDRPAAALATADALGDEDRLAVGMGVPGGPGARREVNAARRQARGPDGAATVSMKTVPVNHSVGPAMVSMEFLVICISFSLGLRLTRGAAHCPTSWSVKNSHNCEFAVTRSKPATRGALNVVNPPSNSPALPIRCRRGRDLKHDQEIPALSGRRRGSGLRRAAR